jgi:hypothetical protein
MLGSEWIQLLERIPIEMHDKLLVLTSNGTEINLQDVVRTEPEYVVFRGRLAASTDAGRIFIVPFEQICLVGFREIIPEGAMRKIFGSNRPATPNRADPCATAAAAASGHPSSDAQAALDAPATEVETTNRPTPADAPKGVAIPPRSPLFERLRRSRANAGPMSSGHSNP